MGKGFAPWRVSLRSECCRARPRQPAPTISRRHVQSLCSQASYSGGEGGQVLHNGRRVWQLTILKLPCVRMSACCLVLLSEWGRLVLQSDVVYRPDCLLAGQTQTGAASVCQSPPACQLAQMRGERQGRCHCLTGASRQASQPTKKASQPTEYLEINLGKSLSFPSPAPSVCPASQTFHYILYFMVAS